MAKRARGGRTRTSHTTVPFVPRHVSARPRCNSGIRAVAPPGAGRTTHNSRQAQTQFTHMENSTPHRCHFGRECPSNSCHGSWCSESAPVLAARVLDTS
eukprot:3990824-Prymnesium_polylepis.1